MVNTDGSNDQKRAFCESRGIEYIVLERTPADGLEARSSSDIKSLACQIPTRLDLAGTWIDQPYVSYWAPGWAITISVEPRFEIRDRCGLSTSTRKMIQKLWPVKLPEMEPEMLAKLVFCFENDPERKNGYISGAQDSIGICIPGLCRHWYNNCFWPEKIERCSDEEILSWLEGHLCMVPMEPRDPDCSVIEGKDITPAKVKNLASAAEACWDAIMNRDLDAFAAAYRASFEAQVAMFPGMVKPTYIGKSQEEIAMSNAYIQEAIDKYSAMEEVLAWKMPGAGGGGYLALVVKDSNEFCANHAEAFTLTIRRT